MRKTWIALASLTVIAVGGFIFLSQSSIKLPREMTNKSVPVGGVIATYKKVPAYQNGSKVTRSHGRHYAPSGYYYGQKWQCVEYVKRFYHDALGHEMPSVWGHAKDFFDPEVAHGEINPARGLVQYRNGGDIAPMANDLLVFRKGSLGHVAIVTQVTANSIEVIQQNVHGAPRSSHRLMRKKGTFTVGEGNKPAGWLRLPTADIVRESPR